MSNQISLQANKLWGLISAPTTAVIYKQALSITWTILKETGKLLWLVFCVFLVAFDWFWNNSIRMGRQSRAWMDKFDRTNDMASEEMWEDIVSSTRSSFNSLVTKARKQLGLYGEPDLSSVGSSTSGAIVPATSAEIAPISTVSPMKRYEAAGEDEPVILSGGFMANSQSSSAEESSMNSDENPSGTIETNAEPETVSVKSVSPKQKDKVGEDEEVEHSPLKDANSPTNS
ncbi:hypothetical protein [Leptolyngbya ohadii]|uniref:hypothetical protein n=1 Tax=Leptolyngbya ohadii TaxID=1962290 RepID=UPI000B5A1E0C|nr:hypothetical protein [Leptolyngbya ohadii]